MNVGRDGRVLSVLGSPAHELKVASATPALDAGEALRAVQDDVGVPPQPRAPERAGGRARARPTYGDDTSASLATLAAGWRGGCRYRAGDDAVYDATVDARTGEVLRRANMVKSESRASVWERFPGSGPGGTAATVDLERSGWLAGGGADARTARTPTPTATSTTTTPRRPRRRSARVGGGFSFPLQPVAGSGCDAAHLCSWSGGTDRTLNRQQDAVQAFYFANRFHDHLAAAPIGFTAAKGAFEGGDDLLLETLDGAATGPDGNHLNNANMFTPPDGRTRGCRCTCGARRSATISSGSDAAILYHEYTHGLSNRLVTDADGYGALNSAQAGAMGEAWSDWYAQDFIVAQFPALDTGAVGRGRHGRLHRPRRRVQAALLSRWTARSSAPTRSRCPGARRSGSGGYTYGDFGRVAGGAEVHADGEIWAQTLWDLRTAVGVRKGSGAGDDGDVAAAARAVLPGRAQRRSCSPTRRCSAAPTATDLDASSRGAGWASSRRRSSGDDTAPAESFALPPAADGAEGHDPGPRHQRDRRRGRWRA